MKNIKNIIFDLGGVILNIDYKLTQEAFLKLGICTENGLYSQQAQSELFDELETGHINEEQFVARIQALSSQPLQSHDIIKAWNAMLLDFSLRRLQILQQLMLHFNLYLCSNTNEIHEKAFNQLLQNTLGFPNLGVFFDKVYMSHRVGLRKPNPDFFELILKENNLKPEETLFIDDSLQHIETAIKLGLKTIHIKDGITMENDIFKPKE
jgi:glucose-1-phosphatase